MSKGFTTPAIHFKGSGWAKKDRSSTSASKSSTDSSDATDAKPAATTEGQGKDKASTGTASAAKPEANPAPSAGSAD